MAIFHTDIVNVTCIGCFEVLEGARASTGLCVDVSSEWTNDMNESN